jgi:arylsulfatase A-like enzyme
MTLSRRAFLRATSGLTVGSFVLACRESGGRPEGAGRGPNVLLILADQLRWDALSIAGNPVVRTPNLDRLARDGVRFSDAVCAVPLCGPSRASILTGGLTSRHGCSVNAEVDADTGIALGVPTFDELLHARGWHCEYHGKWHTGPDHRACYPDGLPSYLELFRSETAQAHPPPPDWEARGWRLDSYTGLPYEPFAVDGLMRRASEAGEFLPHRPEAGETYLSEEDSLTAWIAKRAIRFLRSRPPRPFSLTCSFLAPHAPLVAPRPYSRMFDPALLPAPANPSDDWMPDVYRSVPRALQSGAQGMGAYSALYFGLVAELDRWVGEILRALDETGLAEDTIVIFTSDHGELLGSHGMVAKGVFFEEAWRVPLLIRASGLGRPGLVSDAQTTGRDLFATILDGCGVVAPVEASSASTSLATVLDGRAPTPTHAFGELATADFHQFAVRTADWKLVLPQVWEPGLFDLRADPGETRNRLDPRRRTEREAEVARGLLEALRDFLRRSGDPAAESLPELD